MEVSSIWNHRGSFWTHQAQHIELNCPPKMGSTEFADIALGNNFITESKQSFLSV